MSSIEQRRFDRQQFISDLRYLATLNCPWRHQGTSPETGMDCIGVMRWCYERQGLNLPADLLGEWYWRRPPDGWRMVAIMREWFIELAEPEVKPADLIVVYQKRNPCHVLARIDDANIAEAYMSRDAAISKFLIRPPDPRYRVAACFRIPDFA